MASILLLGHQKRTGKDTIAKMMIAKMEALGIKAQKLSFADALKEYCKRETGIDFFNEEEKIKHRQVLIDTSDEIRATDDDIWVRTVDEAITEKIVVITDFRYPHEYDYLTDRGHNVFPVKITRRDLPEPTDGADTALNGWDGWDTTIYNDGSLEELEVPTHLALNYFLQEYR